MAVTTPQDSSTSRRGLGRRALLIGSAWSAPTIALAVAAPASSASTKTTMLFNTPPQMFIQNSTWNPSIAANVALNYRFETKYQNTYQPNAVTIVTSDIVVSYQSAYIADVPLTNLSAGLTEIGRVVNGALITFTIRLSTPISNGTSSPDLSWIVTALPGVRTSQAVQFTATVSSPQASNVLTHSGANPTW